MPARWHSGTVAATATTVSAAPNGWNQDWKKNNWNGNKNWNGNGNWKWRNRRHNNNFLFPLILGGAIGYGLSQSYPYPYGATFDDGYSDAHARWCFAHYPRSYNPDTNTYFPSAASRRSATRPTTSTSRSATLE